MKVTHYHTEGPIKGVCKQYAIWARESGTSGYSPLAFLQRPKWIKDDEAWHKIVCAIKLNLPKGYEVK